MKKCLIIFCFLPIIACSSGNNQSSSNHLDSTPLMTFEVNLDTVQWKEIRLKGKNKVIKEEFIDMNSTLWKKGDLLIFRNATHQYENVYLVYRLPEYKLIKKFGMKGNGPDELLFPIFTISNNNKNRIGTIYDEMNGNYFEVGNDFSLRKITSFPDLYKRFVMDVSFDSDSTAFYLGNASKDGNCIYRYNKLDNSQEKVIHDLTLLPGITFFYAYSGSYGVNTDRNRIVYAYKFFREVRLMDIDGKLIRVLKGKDKNHAVTNNSRETWMDNPDRPYYYDYCYTTDQHFYLVYGNERTLGENVRGTSSKESIIEQYDWDGNPIRRIILDKICGKHLVVDEDENRIYINVHNEDDPLFIYDLPK